MSWLDLGHFGEFLRLVLECTAIGCALYMGLEAANRARLKWRLHKMRVARLKIKGWMNGYGRRND